jgi:acetolactate synthase regulatory subunit
MEKTNKDVISLEGPNGNLPIKADDKPVLLERVLRVVRHRGFVVKSMVP